MSEAAGIVVTNNDAAAAWVRRECGQALTLVYADETLMATMTKARDLVHKGHRLLTSPLAGNFRPDQMPYKSVLLSADAGDVDAGSLMIIEHWFAKYNQCMKNAAPPQWDEKTRENCKMIDLSLVERALRTV